MLSVWQTIFYKPSLHKCWNTMPCPDQIHANIGIEFKTKTANDSASDIMRPDAWSMTGSTSQGIHFKEHVSTSDTNTEALCFIAYKDEFQLGPPDKCFQYDDHILQAISSQVLEHHAMSRLRSARAYAHCSEPCKDRSWVQNQDSTWFCVGHHETWRLITDSFYLPRNPFQRACKHERHEHRGTVLHCI